MFRRLLFSALLLALLLTPSLVSGADAPKGADLNKEYELTFQTRRVDDRAPFQVTVLNAGEGRIRLVACVTDGGGITEEKLDLTSREKLADGTTVLTLTYTLDGQPCKALFFRELQADLRLSVPGVYRIKLRLHELYYKIGPIQLGEKEIKLG